MNLFNNDSITILNRNADNSFSTYQKNNCVWLETVASNLLGDGKVKHADVTVIIPNDSNFVEIESFSGSGWTLKPNDYIIKGPVSLENVTSANVRSLQTTYGSKMIKIESVIDRRSDILRSVKLADHFEVVGK